MTSTYEQHLDARANAIKEAQESGAASAQERYSVHGWRRATSASVRALVENLRRETEQWGDLAADAVLGREEAGDIARAAELAELELIADGLEQDENAAQADAESE